MKKHVRRIAFKVRRNRGFIFCFLRLKVGMELEIYVISYYIASRHANGIFRQYEKSHLHVNITIFLEVYAESLV